jgi:hypothetical protein
MYKLLEYCTGLFFAFFIAYLVLSAVQRRKGRDDPFEGRLGPVLFVLHSGWVLLFFVLLFFGAMIAGTEFSLIMLAALVNLSWRGRFKDYQRKIIWAGAIIVVVGWLLRFVEINGYPPLQLLARGLDFTSK